jgi:hypothetical protein
MYRKNCVNFIGLKKFSSLDPFPFSLLRISVKFCSIFSNSRWRGGCAPAQIQKELRMLGRVHFALRWVLKDGCAQRATRPHGPSRVYYREVKGWRLCAATSLGGGRWMCSWSPSSSSPASTSWPRPYPLTPEETEIPQPTDI